MHSGILLRKDADQLVPDDVVDSLFTKYRTTMACAVCEGGVVEVLSAEPQKAEELKSFFNQTQTVFKDYAVHFCFQDYPDADLLEDDLQPFKLINNPAGKPILVAFISGDFPNYQKGEDAHSPAYFLTTEYLQEKCSLLYEDVGHDLKKLHERISRPSFLKDLAAQGGNIVLLFGTGQAITSPAESGSLHEWGWLGKTSSEEPEEETLPTQVPAAAEGSLAERLRALAAAKSKGSPPSPPATSVPPVIQVTPPLPATQTAIPPTAGKVAMVQVPPKLTGKARKKWWARHFGSNRPADLSLKEWPVSKLKADSPLRDARSMTELSAALAASADLEGEDTDEELDEQASGISTEVPPLIPPGQAKEITEKFLKDIPLVDVENILEVEKQYPSFFDRTGCSIEEFLRWPYKTRRAFCAQFPTAAAIVQGNICNLLIEACPSLLKRPEKTQEPEKSKLDIFRAKMAAARKAG